MTGVFKEGLITYHILICILVFLCMGCSYSKEHKMYCFLGIGEPKPTIIKRKIKITDVYSRNDIKKSLANNGEHRINIECVTVEPFSFKTPYLNRLINMEHELHEEANQIYDNRYDVDFFYSDCGISFIDEKKGNVRNYMKRHKYFHVDHDKNLVIEYPTYFPESVRISIMSKGYWSDNLESSGSYKVDEFIRYKGIVVPLRW